MPPLLLNTSTRVWIPLWLLVAAHTLACSDLGAPDKTKADHVDFETRHNPIVGDGILDGGEECDDGNTTPGDGCDASGQIELGYNCSTTTLPSLCAPDVTAIYTNGNGGFWFSSVDNLNGGNAGGCGGGICATPWSQGGLAPDVTHDLLAFTWDGQTYSTGVDDAVLDTQNVPYTPARWRGLPVGNIQLSGSGNVQYGSFLDGDVGSALGLEGTIFEGEAFFNDASVFLRDGVRGLGLNSFINNVEYTNTYRLPILDPRKVGDGVPDFLFVNGASASNSRSNSLVTMRWRAADGTVLAEDQINISRQGARVLQR
ncbi:MAG: myxococcus cysteine-rich repeat containing protein, partial [Myxococcota bacterium]